MDICQKCGMRNVVPSRYEDEESVCVACGYTIRPAKYIGTAELYGGHEHVPMPAAHKGRPPSVHKDAIIAEYFQGASVSELSLKYNMSDTNIYHITKEAKSWRALRGLPTKPTPKRRKRVRRTRAALREAAIIEQYQNGASVRDIAGRHNLSTKTIYAMTRDVERTGGLSDGTG